MKRTGLCSQVLADGLQISKARSSALQGCTQRRWGKKGRVTGCLLLGTQFFLLLGVLLPQLLLGGL